VRRGDVVDRLRELLQRERPTPEEQAWRSAVKAGKRELRVAKREHAARVRERRKALATAQRAQAEATREAERELAEARRSDEDAFRRAEASLELAGQGELLGRYGPLALYDDRVVAPEGTAPLARSTRAVVDLPLNLVQRERAIARLGGEAHRAAVRALERRQGHGTHLFLVLETSRFVSVVPCNHGETEAHEFAQQVCVAALNAEDFARRRAEAVALAQRRLDHLGKKRGLAIRAAEQKLAEAKAETQAIDEARSALAAAEADTEEVERRSANVVALQRGQPVPPRDRAADESRRARSRPPAKRERQPRG
jgi:hypothetical protein